VWFEFGKYPNSNFPPFNSPQSFFPNLISRPRAGFLFPDQPSRPNQQRISAHLPTFKPATPISCRQTGPACRSTTHPHPCFPHLGSAPHQESHVAAGPHAEGPVRAHARVESGPGREIPLLPRTTHLYILACAKGSGAASAARAVKAGAAWGFRHDVCGARVQKQGRRLRPRRPSYQPPLGFSLSSSPERAP
jgi:hypothetical protein